MKIQKQLVKSLLLCLAVSLCQSLAFADIPFQVIGQPRYGGDGCRQGTLSYSISPDGGVISMLFDSFSVEAKRGVRPIAGTERLRNKSCTIRFPIQVAKGYNIEAVSIDYRGFAQIPAGHQGVLSTQGAITSRYQRDSADAGVPVTTQFSNISDSFFVSQKLNQAFLGRCRNIRSLDFTTQLRLVGTGQFDIFRQDGMMMLDSIDIDSGMAQVSLHVRATPCK